jgi:hypothetical protein
LHIYTKPQLLLRTALPAADYNIVCDKRKDGYQEDIFTIQYHCQETFVIDAFNTLPKMEGFLLKAHVEVPDHIWAQVVATNHVLFRGNDMMHPPPGVTRMLTCGISSGGVAVYDLPYDVDFYVFKVTFVVHDETLVSLQPQRVPDISGLDRTSAINARRLIAKRYIGIKRRLQQEMIDWAMPIVLCEVIAMFLYWLPEDAVFVETISWLSRYQDLSLIKDHL